MYEVPQISDYSSEVLDRAERELLSALDEEKVVVQTTREFETFRNRWLARKNGILAQINDRWLKAAPKDKKRTVGEKVNYLNKAVEGTVAAVRNQLAFAEAPTQEISYQIDVSPELGTALDEISRTLRQRQLERHRLDISLPGIRRPLGAEHPIIRTMNEFVAVFQAMGYSVEEGPEVETDYYNFEALNFPPNHPARDMQDTLFVAGQERKPQRDRLMLRTHTSPVQIRAMMKSPPPLRILCPGKVHRRDAADATHSPMFHQVEGLAVDTNITLGDLKGSLDHAMKALYGASVRTRFQPSFFPFTEPSAEMYVSCPFCGSKGCRICKQSGWIELGGCGMVHPNVFRGLQEYGYDPEKISGFAFGMGMDRIAALRWGINDIQLFFQGDVRFLEQFA